MTPNAAQRAGIDNCRRAPVLRESLDAMKAELCELQSHVCSKRTEEAECSICGRMEELRADIHAAERYGEQQNFRNRG